MEKRNDSDFQVEEVILSDSNTVFTDVSITSPSEQSKNAEKPFTMIKKTKNEGQKGQIIIYYSIEPTPKRFKLEQETPNPELKKKMQNAIRSKRYRERLKLKKESLKVGSLLNDIDDAQSNEQSISVEDHKPELQKEIQITNKKNALLSRKDDYQSDIPMEELSPELKKRRQAAIRSKQYRERLKLRKESLEVDLLLVSKEDFRSDVQGDNSMEAVDPVLKKKMQAAIRSKQYQDRLKLRKKSLEVDSQSDALEKTSAEILKKEKRKMQGAIRTRRYRERLKLAKEHMKINQSESDDVSGDIHKDGSCLFSLLIRKLQHQLSSLDLPKQLLQSPTVHSCTDTNNTMRILSGELDTEALDCVTIFSKLLDMNKGVWPVKYS